MGSYLQERAMLFCVAELWCEVASALTLENHNGELRASACWKRGLSLQLRVRTKNFSPACKPLHLSEHAYDTSLEVLPNPGSLNTLLQRPGR